MRAVNALGMLSMLLAPLGPFPRLRAQPANHTVYEILTVAGDGTRRFGGDGGAATNASLFRPTSVAVDGRGTLFIADIFNNRIRRVSSDGVISTLAGTGVAGDSGDDGPAAAATLSWPYGVAVDRAGVVYVADTRNQRIRCISPDGIIRTFAGDGRRGFGGDGGAATSASLNGPDAVLADSDGNIYIADTGNNRVRKVDARGIITTIAGNGYRRYNGSGGFGGDGGLATGAQLSAPAALAIDARGSLYIVDFGNNAVRRVSPAGVIETVAGTGIGGYNGDEILAVEAQLNQPGGVAVTPDGSVLIGDGLNARVRRIDTDGVIHTIAGYGDRLYSGDGGPAGSAGLAVVDMLAVDAAGDVFVADHTNSRIRKLVPHDAVPADPEAEQLLIGARAAYARAGDRTIVVRFSLSHDAGGAGPNATADVRIEHGHFVAATIALPTGKHILVERKPEGIVTHLPDEPRPVVVDASAEELSRMLPVRQEVRSFYDWRFTLSTAPGGNLYAAKLRVRSGEAWAGRVWNVLENANDDDGTVTRVFFDPRTSLIARTVIIDAKDGALLYDGQILRM
jgi:sugar lactone lactonase YvrE